MTALRVVTGGLMAGHGLQKLFGWFDGHGLAATSAGFDGMGLRPGKHHAVAAGVSETLGGVGHVLGVFTPAASAMTTGTMTVAIAAVHGKNGPWITKGGYEYNATLIATAFALAAAGPGKLALDGRLTPRRAGLGWGLAQLVAGSLGGLAVVAAARRRVPPPAPAVEVEPGAAATPA